MKIFKRIAIAIIGFIVLVMVGSYLYFDQKFTPEDNYLTLKNESGQVPITWLGTDKNVLLVPVKFTDDSTKYYMQFDTGSPYTLFYFNSIKNIKGISVKNDKATTSFQIGNTQISSDKFMLFYSDNLDEANDSVKIIGTIGADILEDRKTAINLKESQVAFNLSEKPIQFKNNLSDFKFKKRKIIVKAFLNGEEEKFIYDSGTSAYELLTNKEVWQHLKSPSSKIVVEKAKSWENMLTSYTANCKNKILLDSTEIPLSEVTYVEGFSEKQYLMMKFSGMTGMLGNKIFSKNSIYLDCIDNKIGIN